MRTYSDHVITNTDFSERLSALEDEVKKQIREQQILAFLLFGVNLAFSAVLYLLR